MELNLEKSKNNEINILVKIYMIEFSKPPYNEKWTKNKATKILKFYKEFYDLYTIKVAKEIVGFISINPSFMCPGEVAFAEELVIKKEFQYKGIGTWTIKTILDIYKKKGFKRLIGIVNMNTKAFSLYQKLGIKVSKDDVLIEKKLN